MSKLLTPVGEGCMCVAAHSPSAYITNRHHIVPLSWNGPNIKSNLITICANTHNAVHRLLDEYVRQNGQPPWEFRRQFGIYVRNLAEYAWERRPPVPTYTLHAHARSQGSVGEYSDPS